MPVVDPTSHYRIHFLRIYIPICTLRIFSSTCAVPRYLHRPFPVLPQRTISWLFPPAPHCVWITYSLGRHFFSAIPLRIPSVYFLFILTPLCLPDDVPAAAPVLRTASDGGPHLLHRGILAFVACHSPMRLPAISNVLAHRAPWRFRCNTWRLFIRRFMLLAYACLRINEELLPV